MLRGQLLEAGLGRGAIAHRLRNGRLHRYLRDVLLVGPDVVDALGLETAAVLAFRGHAVLSHRTAAAVWGLIEAPPPVPVLTIAGRELHRPSTLDLHRSRTLTRGDVRRSRDLPVTSPARTLIDLATEADGRELERAVAEGRRRGLLTEEELHRALERSAGHHGVPRLRAVVEQETGPALTRSQAERRLLDLVRQAELPVPVANGRVRGFEVDFLWPDCRLVVEIDGFAFHGDRRAFERDRRRDQTLAAAGYRVIRITWRQLVHESLAVIARLAQALAAP